MTGDTPQDPKAALKKVFGKSTNGNTVLTPGNRKKVPGLWILGGVIAVLLSQSFVVVEGGHKGVVVTLGKIAEEPLTEGVHVVWPILTTVKHISTRIENTQLQTEAASKDLQNLVVNAVVNWSVNPDKVVDLYRRYGDLREMQNRMIVPYSLSVLKSESTKYAAESLLQNRRDYEQKVSSALSARLQGEGIQVQDVNIAQFEFTPEFNRAIENKQIAQQEAQKAFYLAEKSKNEAQALREQAKGEADAAIERARGQSEAQKQLNQTLTRAILTYQWISKWDGKLPTVMTSDDSSLLLNLPQTQATNP
jgi:regulator of protease activity HflC (stomatin/prohibitin superfamily)